MENVSVIYCDGGGKIVALFDTNADRYMFSQLGKYSEHVGEYRAILFALKYVDMVYRNNTITIITDGLVEADMLNGVIEQHKDSKPIKQFAKLVKDVLTESRQRNNIEITWVPRERNVAGKFLEKFSILKRRTRVKHRLDVISVDFSANLITPKRCEHCGIDTTMTPCLDCVRYVRTTNT